jgi:pimeloyl-ACP methyl ester carboxylesterase
MTDGSPVVQRFVNIGATTTRVLEVSGDGPTTLLLHGFSDSADSWRPLLGEFAARSRRAVAIDLPGSGHAAPLGRPPLRFLDQFAAGFVRRYADEDGAILAGNSLGGMVALRTAASSDLPLVAVAGLGPAGLAYHPRLDYIARRLAALDPILWMADRLPVPTPIVRRTVSAMYSHRLTRGRASASLARLYASHINGMRDLGRIRRDLIALTTDETLLGPGTLGNIRVPVLLIWGDADPLADVRGAAALLDAVPASILVVLEDCGHLPQVEFPAEVAQMLLALPGSAIRQPPDRAPEPANVGQGKR